ncbi:MAG TPA: glycosyltransferase family 4 protein [Myxococcales bacterium]|nr:glycosyltransferase family 4 protein [Myxococcales bacterium]
MSWPKAPLLMVSSSSRTGPAEGLISLARELRGRGIDARFAGDTVREGENLDEHLARAGVPWETELRLSRKVRLGDVLHDVSRLTAWAREGRYDVFHAAFAHDHALAAWAARRARNPELRLVRAAQREIDVRPGSLRLRLRALRRSDGVIVHAAQYRQALLGLGLDERRVEHVPGGVDAGWFSPGQAAGLRARWGVPAGARLAGIVARMKPERGHRALLRAWAEVERVVPRAWLVLVGRGEEEGRLRALARELGLGRLVFGGYQRGPALLQAYRALDVAVWLREGNDGACRGVLEAMACGVPVVAGDVGAPPELVGGTGRVVAPGEPAAIATALGELLDHEALARELGAAARERAVQFTTQRAADATLAFWRRLRDLPRISG